ncbi:MAG TPA: alpha/beta hydrolase-fold protein, partial [Phycisphaerae bacterium]|nr:alpha/beta hydrolase-fold protein [Phycisphaerae bacterium]
GWRRILRAVLLGAAVAAGGRAMAAEPVSPAVVWKKYIVRSPSTDKIERFWVGHAARLKADGRYPVLYCLPGLMDGDDTWKSALEPSLEHYEVIVVCPAVGGATWFMNSPAKPWMRWGDFLTEDLRAFIESNYPASSEKGQRGIVGISAGGHGAFYHALMRPDLYGSVSLLSGAMELRGYVGAVGLDYWIGPRSAETLPLYTERSCIALAVRQQGPLPFDLFLDSGNKDGALQQMVMLRQVLDTRGFSYRWFVGEGGHDWTYWKSRAATHLAWHVEQFARNQREGRYTEKTPTGGATLEVLNKLPDIALSAETAARLRAPWTAESQGRPIPVKGLPKDGVRLDRADEPHKQAELKATLAGAEGQRAGVFVYRLRIVASAPADAQGTLSLQGAITNGQGRTIISIPSRALAVAAGEPEQRVELRARLAVEIRPPDPLRGGMVCGLQVFDAEGKAVGDPAVGKAKPGSVVIERWPVASQAKVTVTLRLSEKNTAPSVTVHKAMLETEETAP